MQEADMSGNENKDRRARPGSGAQPQKPPGKQKHDHMANPEIHDGAAQQPGGPEPGSDPRQGHRSQKNSI
jgi:hypothetical protein